MATPADPKDLGTLGPLLLKDLNDTFYNRSILFTPILVDPVTMRPYSRIIIDYRATDILIDLMELTGTTYKAIFVGLVNEISLSLGVIIPDLIFTDPVEQVLNNIKKEIYGS